MFGRALKILAVMLLVSTQPCLAIDLDQLTTRYTEFARQPENDKSHHDAFYIFISSSMPDKMIESLYQQGEAHGAKLVIFGLIDNDISKTIQYRDKIFGQKSPGQFDVAPELFEAYAIDKVPSFVLTNHATSTLEGQLKSVEFDVVCGNVSVDAALERIAQNGSPQMRELAEDYLKEVRGS